MSPKEKAKQLYEKYEFVCIHKHEVKKCVLIAVEEIIQQWEYIDTYLSNGNGTINPNLGYWYEVEKFVNEMNK